MSSKKKKIEIPTDEEVARYGEGSGGQDASDEAEESPQSQQDDAQVEEGDVPAGDAEAAQWKDRYLRAKAELANYQRRAEKEKSDALRYAHASLVKGLLPILDDLERVLEAGEQHKSDVDGVVAGVRLVMENMFKVLKDFGVIQIEAKGQPFDPSIHEALMQQPSEEYDIPSVLQEMAKGYRMHDRVLRPAKVIVSKPGASEAPAETPDESAGEDAGDTE